MGGFISGACYILAGLMTIGVLCLIGDEDMGQ